MRCTNLGGEKQGAMVMECARSASTANDNETVAREKFLELERKAFMLVQILLSLAFSSPAKSDNRVVQMKRLPL